MSKKIIPISILNVVVFVFLGFLNAKTSNDAAGFAWYDTLMKSTLNPPNFVFAVAWSVLYVLIGLSFTFLLFSRTKDNDMLSKKYFNISVVLFIVQFIVNLVWSYLFWTLRSPLLGLIDIIILDILVIVLLFMIIRVSKVSFLLLLPYTCWIFFATYLNLYIFLMN